MIKEKQNELPFQQIEHFTDAHNDENPGRQLHKIRMAVPSFKEWFKATERLLLLNRSI